MPKNDEVPTPSGVMVPASDIDQIRKDARNNTVRNVLAGIGLFAVATFALGVVNARREAKNSSTE